MRCEACPAPRLLPEAMGGVVAYLLCITQWRMDYGVRYGLDYLACKAVIGDERRRFKHLGGPRQAFRDMQVIEQALLTCDAEARTASKASKDAVGASE